MSRKWQGVVLSLSTSTHRTLTKSSQSPHLGESRPLHRRWPARTPRTLSVGKESSSRKVNKREKSEQWLEIPFANPLHNTLNDMNHGAERHGLVGGRRKSTFSFPQGPSFSPAIETDGPSDGSVMATTKTEGGALYNSAPCLIQL